GLVLSSLLLALTACGGGGGSEEGAASTIPQDNETSMVLSSSAAVPATDKPATRQEAARFLTQATFGPTQADIDRLMIIGYAGWFKEQAAAPTKSSYVGYWDSRTAAIRSSKPLATA